MIAVVDAGCGNLRSVEKALFTAGGQPMVTADPELIRRADRVVMPGQGAFGDCMRGISGGIAQAVREHIERGKPYFGICLGLQVLFSESEEQGPVAGLGLLAGRVIRFAARPGLKIPHMGWNQVRSGPAAGELPAAGEHFYFVHSYYAVPTDRAVVALECDYGQGPFCAAVRKDNIVATQFHPEKSQRAGLALLRWFACS